MIEVSGDICLSGLPAWSFAALSPRTLKDGVPRQRFRKEIIRLGDYVKHSDGIRFSVTPDLNSHWQSTFHRMRVAGVRVPITAGHECVDDPDKTRGYVEDMFVDGDSLVMLCELIGDDAINAAARNDVSIGCPAEFVDGKGNRYVRPIHHVALTPNPVIPGLGAFEPIAASLGKDVEMNWKEIAKRLGIKDVLTDANAAEKIEEAFKGQQTVALSAIGKALGADGITAVDEIEPTVKSLVDKRVADLFEKSKTTEPKVDPMLLNLSRENFVHKLDGLVAAGRITPAVKDKLSALYLSDTALTLSLSRNATGEFDSLVEILKSNDPVELRGRTGPQTLKLANPFDAAENPLVKDAVRRAELEQKRATA